MTIVASASGSRLLTGNHQLYGQLEDYLVAAYGNDVLVYNSGYTANLGVLASVPQRGDIILYDELSHASIRDGIQLSNAKSYKFRHNDLQHLSELLDRYVGQDIYVVTESVFSMDGDSPDLISLSEICNEKKAYLIVDEAHAVGVFGLGLLQQKGISSKVFAQIVTFGKGLGSHGAAVVGSKELTSYLVNFSRSLIYATASSPHTIATTLAAFRYLQSNAGKQDQLTLRTLILYFETRVSAYQLSAYFIENDSAIKICLVGGNEKTKKIAGLLQEAKFDIRPILSPTVAVGSERLRICLHAYNTEQEIDQVLQLLQKELNSKNN